MDSIMAQSYEHWELLVVNDHSTDDTLKVLRTYALADKRIKVFGNEGRGIIDALNIAYFNAKGDYITRMDADDIMPKHKILRLLQSLQHNGKAYVSTGYVKYFSSSCLGDGYIKYESWLNNLTANANNFNEIYKECVIPSPCWMMHRDDFERIGAFRSKVYPEDYDLCFRMYQNGIKVVGVKEVCHYWRDHSARATRNDANYADNNFLALKLEKFLEIDFKKDKDLLLWGAGRKGKWIAQQFTNKEVPFTWICDNPKKIGKEIYGKILFDSALNNLGLNKQFIIAVANKKSLFEIKRDLSSQEAFYFA
jgi:glycosyltransferase involved in cell wall biosynthesis